MPKNPYPETVVPNNNRHVWQEGYEAGWNEAKAIVQKVNAEADDLKVFERMILAAFVPQQERR